MKSELVWKSKYTFEGRMRSHSLMTDASRASGGDDQGPTPKELVLAAICGCTGMDVVGYLRKLKAELSSLLITAEADTYTQHPKTFKQVHLVYSASGPEQSKASLIEAVAKSQNLYCGVSAMLAQACPISYDIILNGEKIHHGVAEFKLPEQ